MNVYVVTLGFARPEIIRSTFERLYETRALQDFTHIVVDQHYPLPDELETQERLRALCKEYACRYLDPGVNLGLAGGLNYAFKNIGDLCNSIVIGYDPDVLPTTPGWDKALVEVLETTPLVAWASLGNDFSEREMRERGYEEKDSPQGPLWFTKCAVLNSVCAWRGDWLAKVGGIIEENAYYGGLESKMFAKLLAEKKKWVFLKNFRECRNEATQGSLDQSYHDYKMAHAHQKSWGGDFKSYLEFRRKNQ